tara:strand:- start:196 stop:369 length:174 start_codon:yes stop_codon:yes gene_type:complete
MTGIKNRGTQRHHDRRNRDSEKEAAKEIAGYWEDSGHETDNGEIQSPRSKKPPRERV